MALVAGCAHGPIKPAPPPLRPPPPPKVKKAAKGPADCAPTDASKLAPAVPYANRSIAEAQNLTDEGLALLKKSVDRSQPVAARDGYLTTAVARFITALHADPYNVRATYNLAAAYARIGRTQCAVNLLGRLLPLRNLASHKKQAEQRIDHLLGRGAYRDRMDPDFDPLRDDPRFRKLVEKF